MSSSSSSSLQQQRSIPTVDRISALPDSIICHILSFLSTKQSAATSILSKRWKPLWLSVLTLDFDFDEFTYFNTFRLFVDSVMLTRHPTFPIRSFRLRCPPPVKNAIPLGLRRLALRRAAVERAAVQQRIQNLILDLFGPFQIRLGHTVSTIFISRNFVILKLNALEVDALPQIDFPLLKTLHLELVIFQNPNDLDRLFEACPILEELQLTSVAWRDTDDGGEFKCFPNLVRANITSFRDLNISFDWICNAKFLRLDLNNEQQVRTFHNLTQLELIFSSNWRSKWKWLVLVLQNCPKLQNLILHKLYEQRISEEDNWNEPQIIPICISSQLRTCLLIDYKGMKCELQFAEYVLKNANLLRIMTISASPLSLNSKHQMLMDLSLCPRGSTTCKLSFI